MTAKKVLVCSQLMPEFDKESGSRRIFDVIELLREDGWEVTFVAQYAPNGERYARLLQQRGVAVYVGFDARTDRLIASSRFDLAVIAFWHIAEQHLPVWRRLSPDTRVVVDSIDLHFMRNARGIFKLGGTNGARVLDDKFAAEMIRELNTYAAADGVLTVTQKEADLVNDFASDPALAFPVPDCEELAASPVPFADRKGIFFLGNFRHVPNVGAAEFLCKEVVPLLPPDLIARHPVSIVGHDLNDTVRAFGAGQPNVHMVGWVPSVLPYLERARVTVIPLLYGAGTKRKLVQALMVGTPTVSTTVGVEGLQLRDGEHVLVADDPADFARGVERLVEDEALWSRLAAKGRTHITVRHGRDVARTRLQQALVAVLAKKPKSKDLARPTLEQHRNRLQSHYQQLIPRLRAAVIEVVPAEARVLVVSKGDEELVRLDGRQGWHFPQAAHGVYAGHHPVDSAAAVAHLEALRAKGAEYLAFPSTSFWWLKHYAEFRQYLDERYAAVLHREDTCLVYDLRRPSASAVVKTTAERPAANGQAIATTSAAAVNGTQNGKSAAGAIGSETSGRFVVDSASRKKVLVLGVYLADQENLAHDLVGEIARSKRYAVRQRWIALRGAAPSERVAAVTAETVLEKTPKYQLLNGLLRQEDLSQYEYVLSVDDDIVLPEGFLDEFLTLQSDLDFALAQPARTSNSCTDHPIVEQQLGVVARRTRFVEIGPVISFHRSVFPLVFPFDLTSPMGWGYENVWSHELAKRDMKMGIIDVTPVDHSLRKPVANYSWDWADKGRSEYLARHAHNPLEECFRILEVVNFEEDAHE